MPRTLRKGDRCELIFNPQQEMEDRVLAYYWGVDDNGMDCFVDSSRYIDIPSIKSIPHFAGPHRVKILEESK